MDEAPKEFEFFEMFFSPELLIPIALVFVVVLLGRGFFRINNGDDEMEKFIALGGDKLDFEAFERFAKQRRFYGNLLLCAALLVVAGLYVYFLTTIV